MRVVALISGGKDSCFNMMQCIAAGHKIVALANLVPSGRTEIDSYMYQSVGYEAIELIAESMDLPLFRIETKGKSEQLGRIYEPKEHDEVEDLFSLLELIKKEIEFDAVSVGAILSDYQRIRVENVCSRLNLFSLAYLWQRDQNDLLNDMIKCEIDAIIIKVAAMGLEPSRHLGRSLRLVEPHLQTIHEQYGVNICGEGGEYETLTIDCPLYKSRIVIEESEIVIHSNDPIAPVGYLKLNKLRLELKLPPLDLTHRLAGLPLKDSDGYVTDYGEEATENEEIEPEIDTIKESSTLIKYNPDFININQKINSVKCSNGWLWISGCTGESDDPKEAIKNALEKLKCELNNHSQSLKDVCTISLYISDMSQFATINSVYVEVLNFPNPPTRACVQVPLPKNCPVIIEAISWNGKESGMMGDQLQERNIMHVQSISHWAPASIGPYSQTVKVGDIIHLAGQIGLVPGSLQLVNGGVKQQCQLALRHVGRLIKAVDINATIRDIVQGVCYISDLKHVETVRKLWEEFTNNAIMNYVVVETLPKNALVEWHVWGHLHNNQFEYEETGKCIDAWSILIYRRWNYENNISAIVCHVDRSEEPDEDVTKEIFKETIEYLLHKLQQGHESDKNTVSTLKIFCPVMKKMDLFVDVLEDLKDNVSFSYTIIPVVALKGPNTHLSICGIRIY
nr:diphthine--ammonia ligase [Onthophagus taurus]XP_022904820.1 diphthine--ammonia ligase [Onthophagus taurus]